MIQENCIERIEDLEDLQPIREFEIIGGRLLPKVGISNVVQYTPQSYLESVEAWCTSDEWFPLEVYSYATNLHLNEIIIWNRYTKRVNYRQSIEIIKN